MRGTNVVWTALASALIPLSMAVAEGNPAPNETLPQLTASQIVEKNVAARGGLSAWRAVQTIEMKGKLEAGGNQRTGLNIPTDPEALKVVRPRPKEQTLLPFVMDLKRGRKMRLEIQFNNQTAVQVYDGTHGWKLRPFLNRHEVEKFSDDEMKTASAQSDLDGLLIDSAARGSTVALEGSDPVQGHIAYRLKVTDKNGNARHVWVDSESFFETKIEGTPRRLDGKEHPVATYLRDYRSVNGLMMPYLMETTVEGVKDSEKILIDNIQSNLKLDDAKFAMPR